MEDTKILTGAAFRNPNPNDWLRLWILEAYT